VRSKGFKAVKWTNKNSTEFRLDINIKRKGIIKFSAEMNSTKL
jgi:hypothetical protein